jgi:hypothetical protein
MLTRVELTSNFFFADYTYSYLLDPYVVLALVCRTTRVSELWVQPLENFHTCFVKPVWMAFRNRIST